MARARNDSIPDTMDDAAEAPPSPDKPREPDDVLVYVDRLGAIRCNWYGAPASQADGKVAIPTNESVRLEPGLSFCPGRLWPKVLESSTWRHRVEQGAAKAVAGHRGDLAGEWAKAKPDALVAKIEKSHHLEALLRMKEMEATSASPRLAVAEAIDLKLSTMTAKVAAHTERRASKRRANRARASRL